jgi:hypothetical protein
MAVVATEKAVFRWKKSLEKFAAREDISSDLHSIVNERLSVDEGY